MAAERYCGCLVTSLMFIVCTGTVCGFHLSIDLENSETQDVEFPVNKQCSRKNMITTCSAMDGDKLVTVVLMLNEIRTEDETRPQIEARFTIGSEDSFVRNFSTDRGLTEYCSFIEKKGEEYCFNVRVKDVRCPRHEDKLIACLKITKPRTVNFHCFILEIIRDQLEDLTVVQDLGLGDLENLEDLEDIIEKEEMKVEEEYLRFVSESELVGESSSSDSREM